MKSKRTQSNNAPSAFSRFAKWAARVTGQPLTFDLALPIILIWH